MDLISQGLSGAAGIAASGAVGSAKAAQNFLNERVDAIKDMLTGQASANTYVDQAKLIAPGGIPGKLGIHVGHQLIKSAGTRDAAKMSLLGLGGNAPAYETVFNDNGLGSYEARIQ